MPPAPYFFNPLGMIFTLALISTPGELHFFTSWVVSGGNCKERRLWPGAEAKDYLRRHRTKIQSAAWSVFNYHALFPFLLSESGTRARGADFNFHAPEAALPLQKDAFILFAYLLSKDFEFMFTF